MRGGLLTTPRPVPGRLVPVASGAIVILLALPIFLIGGWRVGGWGLAAVLWAASELFGLALARLPLGTASLARAGVVAFRAIAVMVVLVALAVSDARLALSAAVVYALAYTFGFCVSLVSYFGAESR